MVRNRMMQYNQDALGILASCFAVASLSGLAVLLRSKQQLTVRIVIAAFLYNGLAGLIIGLLWYNYFGGTNPYFVVGVSGLAGMGTINLIEVTTYVLRVLQTASSKDKKDGDNA